MITINDPKLTAFVLGELTEAEAQEIQTAIESDVVLRGEVQKLRETVALVEQALQSEPLPSREPATMSPIAPRKRFRWLIPAAITAVAASLVAAVLLPTQHIARQPVMTQQETIESELVTDAETTPTPPKEGNNDNSPPPEGVGGGLAKQKESEEAFEYSFKEQEPDRFARPGEIAQFSQVLIDPSTERQRQTEPSAKPQMLSQTANEPVESLGIQAASPPASMAPSSSRNMGMGGMDGGMDGGMMGGMGIPVQSLADSPLSKTTSISTASAGTPFYASPREMPSRPEMSRRTSPRSQTRPLPNPLPEGEGTLTVRDEPYNNEKNEAYKDFTENEFKPVKVGEFSTFSIDVDTAAYSTMRRFINEMNQRPPKDSVRLEEYINYFKYDYAVPTDGKPFAAHTDVFPCPWQPKHKLARIGIKGKNYDLDNRPPLNLVFLIDVSGSMSSSNRLPLVQKGLTDLVEMLQAKDRVAIVTYAGDSRLVLPSVSGQEKRAILDSINALNAGGSTAGAKGIQTAYETARKYYDKQAQNRVILCTDGDFNVGETNNKTLEEMIGEEAKSGVFLSILGFGMGNYKDDRLKTLSMRGNGNYGYIDSMDECRKLLVEGLTSTLFAIAKDVKIQVDFNPARVAGYRLLGYENRKLRDEDFHNDAVDAGEIGAGHTVTALYEIVPAGENVPASIDKSRYDTAEGEPATVSPNNSDELLFVKLRYKEPDGEKSTLLEYPVKDSEAEPSADSQFASAVALYGMLLRSSRHSGNGTFDDVLKLAEPNVGEDKYRQEFVELVKKAKDLR